MPLKPIPKGATPQEIATITSDNIAELVKTGKPQNQAVAVAKQWEEDCKKKNKEMMATGLVKKKLAVHADAAHTSVDNFHKAIDEEDMSTMTVEEMKHHHDSMQKLGDKAFMACSKLRQKAGM